MERVCPFSLHHQPFSTSTLLMVAVLGLGLVAQTVRADADGADAEASMSPSHKLVSRAVEAYSPLAQSYNLVPMTMARRERDHYFRTMKRAAIDEDLAAMISATGDTMTTHQARDHYFRSLRSGSGSTGNSQSWILKGLEDSRTTPRQRSMNVRSGDFSPRDHYFRTLKRSGSGVTEDGSEDLEDGVEDEDEGAHPTSKRYGANYISRVLGFGMDRPPSVVTSQRVRMDRDLTEDLLVCMSQLRQRPNYYSNRMRADGWVPTP